MKHAFDILRELLTAHRPWITEVFFAALGPEGHDGYQCELGFGDMTTRSFQASRLADAIFAADAWVQENKPK